MCLLKLIFVTVSISNSDHNIYVGGTRGVNYANTVIVYICIEDTESVVCPLNGEGKKRAERRREWMYRLYTAIGWSDRHFTGRFQISLPIVHYVCPLYIIAGRQNVFFSTINIRFSPLETFASLLASSFSLVDFDRTAMVNAVEFTNAF